MTATAGSASFIRTMPLAFWRPGKPAERNNIEFDHEFCFRTPDDELRWVHSRATALCNESGEIIGRVGTIEDIMQRNEDQAKLEKVQDDLNEASRQAGMAEIAAGVLHNVGNVLNSINVASHCVADALKTKIDQSEQSRGPIDMNYGGLSGRRSKR